MKADSIVKIYPNGLLKVKKTKFKFDVGSKPRTDYITSDNSEYGKYRDMLRDADYQEQREMYKTEKAKDNMIKTKEKIHDIANSNDFNYFITLTFKSDKVDRFSFNETSKKVRKFMNNYKNKIDSELKYLLVHECHKNGAYHYHGMLYLSDRTKLVDSTKRDKNDEIIYNWQSWKNGFSTCTEIRNLNATRNYILKYIEKDIDKDYVKGQRRFYYSQNCFKPQKEVCLDYPTHNLELSFETRYSVGYERVAPNLDVIQDLIPNIKMED